MNTTLGFVGPLTVAVTDVRSSVFTCGSQAATLRRCATTKRLNTSVRRRVFDRERLVTNIKATAEPIEVNESSFEKEVLKSDVPVVVDFYASWCGPCKLVAPLMDWAAAEYEGRVKMVKIDTESNESFVKRYSIYGLPTFAVFVEGEARGVQEGAMTKPVFQKYIDDYAFSVA